MGSKSINPVVRCIDCVFRFYIGSWTNDVAFPIVSSPHVTMTMGTGCVHTAYAHGFDDYEVE